MINRSKTPTERSREWRQNNPERYAFNRRKCTRNQRLKKFGLTVEAYDALLVRQGGVCAVCASPETVKHHQTGETKRLAVDHCHATGVVRGLLCSKCNGALGWFEKNRLAVAHYLMKAGVL